MAYNIEYTDNKNKGSITVEDGTTNNDTSISFPGRRSRSYGQEINENFLHLLENFSSQTAPLRPVEGQLWYDTSDNINQLKVYDGTSWVASGGLKKSSESPSITTSTPGELWVNTQSQQLYLFTGTAWILVGPEYSDGLLTGTESKIYVGIDNVEYNVLTVRVKNETIFIISNYEFTPKSAIPGFRSGIKPGLNISQETTYGKMRYWGIAEKSENLVVGNETVPSNSFLRSDAESSTNFKLNVNSNEGLSIGTNGTFGIKVENRAGIIENSETGSSIDVRLNNGVMTPTVLRVDPGAVGINNSSPEEALHVVGNVKISQGSTDSQDGRLLIQSVVDSGDESSGSLVTKGGVGIAKSAYIGEELYVKGSMHTSDILPINENLTSIGTSSARFSSIHSQTFYGNLQGNVSGTVSGRAGSSDRLTSATTFSLSGDVEEDSFEFDGQTGGTNKTFNVRISNSFISNKDPIYDANNADEVLINRRVGSSGVYKISKRNFLKDIPLMPPGIIMPYGGNEPPEGWLFCDGQEVLKSDYNILWNIIGHNFKDPVLLSDGGINTFSLPDMRGRFPLGLDNLGGRSANRVTNDAADAVGGNAGSDSRVLDIENIPEHEHNLQGESGTQYYSVRAAAGEPNDDDAITMQIEPGTGGTQGLSSSGKVKTSTGVNAPFNTMNPYLAVNYIIYTGI